MGNHFSLINWVLFALVLISCLSCCLFFYSVFKVTNHSRKSISATESNPSCQARENVRKFLPPVSILKPITGIDPGLKANLSSFCHLDYPKYELIFCLEKEENPALNLVRELQKEHPEIVIKIVIDEKRYGLNPKINNLLRGMNKTSHDFVLISDADVRVDRHYLRNIAGFFQEPSVGMVTNVIRGKGKGSLGAVLENLHLNFFVLGGTCFLYHFLGRTCVTGKSVLFGKEDLKKIGGLSCVKDFLAEDYILGRRLELLGERVTLSSHLITSNNSKRPLSKFFSRALRWSQLRMKLGSWGYISEMLVNPVFWATVLLIVSSSSTLPLSTFLGTSFLKITLESIQGKMIHAEMGLLPYLLTPLKDLLIGLIWFVPFFKTSLEWRGNKLRLRKYTKLDPL